MALNKIKVNNTTTVNTGVVYDITKATSQSYTDLKAALGTDGNNVPPEVREGGMSIRFVSNSDNKYVQYRLAASIWSTNINDWTSEDPYFVDKIMQEVNKAIDEHPPIEITGDVVNAPDEEDLTSVNVGGTDVLKFKDKAYNPLTYSGMGRIILRKNIVFGVNTLTQSMINQANTIHVIQYDFDLGGETVTIPEGCVLEFDGGCLGNGTLVGNSTAIVASIVKIFNTSILIEGTWNVDGIYLEWFGAERNKNIDCTAAFQKAIDFCNNTYGGAVRLLNGMYTISGVNTGIKTSIIGVNRGTSIIKVVGNSNGITIPVKSRGVLLSDFTLAGSRKTNPSVGYGILVKSPFGIEGESEFQKFMQELVPKDYDYQPSYAWLTINNVTVSYFSAALNIESHYNFDTKVLNSTFEYSNTGVRFGCSDSLISNCYISNNITNGLFLDGTNNRVTNIKSIFNNPGINVYGPRNILVNCETQDNYGHGFIITGKDNTLVGCMSNNDCYGSVAGQPDKSVAKWPFLITVPENRISMSGCSVMYYRGSPGVPYYPVEIRNDSGKVDGLKLKIGDEQYSHWKEVPISTRKYFNNKPINGDFTIETIDDNKYIRSNNSENLCSINLGESLCSNWFILIDAYLPNTLVGGNYMTLFSLSNNIDFRFVYWPTGGFLSAKLGAFYNSQSIGSINIRTKILRTALVCINSKLYIYGIYNYDADGFKALFKEVENMPDFSSFNSIRLGSVCGLRHLIVSKKLSILDDSFPLVPENNLVSLYEDAVVALDAETYNANDFS